jgi:hypothetical protein
MITDYMVSFSNGTGGNFLISLIERTVITENADRDGLKLGPYNDAHFSGKSRNFKQNQIIPKKMGDMKEGFLSCVKIDPHAPAFIPGHLYWPDVQFSAWPNSKLAVITHKEEDALDISISGFFKTEMSTSNWHKSDGSRWLTDVPPGDLGFNQNNIMFDSIRKKHPNELTKKELALAVRARMAMVISAGFHLIEPIDDPRIGYIQWRDLISKPDVVADFLTQLTGSEPTEQVHKDIVQYQTRQAEFLAGVHSDLSL